MKTLRNKVGVIIEKTDTGFSAYTENYPVYTTGQTISELLINIVEALNYYLEDQDSKVTPKNIHFEFDLQQFFQYYRVINAKYLAKRIGMNETLLSQYAQGHKKPSPKQTEKILAGIHQIGRELSELNLISR